MTNNSHNFNIRLTRKEEIKFRELTTKILAQQSFSEVLSPSEKDELLQILKKLNLISEDQHPIRQQGNELILLALNILSVAAIFLALAGIPTVAVWIITKSRISTALAIFLAAIVSCIGILSFFGRFQWSWFFTVLFLVALFLIILQFIA
jgi:hypothetical protein